MNKDFLEKYITEISEEVERYGSSFPVSIFAIIRRCINVLGKDLDFDETIFTWNDDDVLEDAKTLIDLLEYKKSMFETVDLNTTELASDLTGSIIFLSHKSDDKKYANAIRNFIVGLGVKDNQLIYTSHPMHKIPLDKNIYDYLRNNINSNIFMIILWSDKYLESPACLNEMGAAWVAQSDYTNIYVPDFSFGNPKYRECAVDTRKMGAVLNGDEHCKASLLELKDKIVNMFALSVDEKKTAYLIDEFIKEIM